MELTPPTKILSPMLNGWGSQGLPFIKRVVLAQLGISFRSFFLFPSPFRRVVGVLSSSFSTPPHRLFSTSTPPSSKPRRRSLVDPVEGLLKKIKTFERKVNAAEKAYNKSNSADDKTRTVLRVDVAGAELAVKELELKLAQTKLELELANYPRDPDLVQAAQNVVTTATDAVQSARKIFESLSQFILGNALAPIANRIHQLAVSCTSRFLFFVIG